MNRLLSRPLLMPLLWLTLSFHLLLAIALPLTVDEAHYALYGQHLALSYFDHPPLVGWLQAAALLLGDGEWQLRLWALLSHALTLWLLAGWSRWRGLDTATINLALLLFASVPLWHLLGLALVPDTLLMPLALALVWQGQRTLAQPDWSNWLLLGLLLGLAGLAKYTAVTLAAGLLLMLLVSGQASWLVSLRLWASVLLAGVLVSPVLIWNAQHEWISFLYQLQHGQPDRDWQLARLLQAQASQLVSYTPLVWLGGWLAMLSVHKLTSDSIHRQLWAFVLPSLLLFAYSSGREPSLPHWLAVVYLLWLPSLAQALWQRWSLSRWRLLTQLNLLLGLTLTLVLAVLMLFPTLGQSLKPNPAADLLGWRDAGQQAALLRQEQEPLLVFHWVEASRLAWYARPVPVLVLDQRQDQFDLWFGSPQPGQSGLLILPPDRQPAPSLQAFEHCEQMDSSAEGFGFYRCRHWRGP